MTHESAHNCVLNSFLTIIVTRSYNSILYTTVYALS